jgi:hypothetical protein
METKPKLIYKATCTHLPTAFPAYYFGMPDGRVYIVYSKYYETVQGKTKIGYDIAALGKEEIYYDYEKEKLFMNNNSGPELLIINHLIGYHKHIKILKTSKSHEQPLNHITAAGFLSKFYTSEKPKQKKVRTKTAKS